MRIDPKYFNLFIGICAFVTIPVIIYSTIRYSQNQVADFKKNALTMQFDTLSFRSFSAQDSLYMEEFTNQPVIIHFWSTWSDKSKKVNEFLKTYTDTHEDLVVIAAAVRDSDKKIMEYINQNQTSFYFVEGTDLFHSLLVPGVPSQIFIGKNKNLFGVHVGGETASIKEKSELFLKP